MDGGPLFISIDGMRVNTYVTAVGITSLVAVAAAALALPLPSPVEVSACVCFALIGLLSHLLAYRTSTNATGSVAFIPFLAAVVLSPNVAAVIVVGLTVFLVELRARRSLLKGAFNISQYVLAASVAVLAFSKLGGLSPLFERVPQTFELLAYFVAFGAFVVVNKLSVSIVVALSERSEIAEVWRRVTEGALLYDLLSLPFAYAYARAYAEVGAGWTLALSVPLLGVRQLYRTNWQLQRTSEELLQLMVKAIEARDPYTSGHSKRVAHYAVIIARSMGMRAKQVDRVYTAAMLHDVGKIHEDFAPILRKPSSLTPAERGVIESHSERGAQLVATVSQLEDIVPVVRHHHERFDGTGYPSRLVGEQIPIGARVIMIADTIDAMTSDRPYRAALSKEQVLAEVDRVSGTQFDPSIVEAFVKSKGVGQVFEAVARFQGTDDPGAAQKSETPRNVRLVKSA